MLQRFSPVLLALSLVAAPALAGDLSVHNAWIRAVPPSAGATAAYVTIENDGTEARSLVGAESPVITGHVELHESKMEKGMMRMIEQESIVIPAGGSTELSPGGYHIMLIRPKPVKEGETYSLTLKFDNGETITVDAPVTRGLGGGHHHHM